ncbi:alcohol dehydrogenase catalytic domain-containing protein [Sporosarcina jiandibaonis]|uniref:alcohol dehydrogenase catalytic domain-containing protein n=1 Tax=Sporosarcina jiandibaonis TaxID=2715535 RepID=UPI001554CB7B|nr:alcohol dehydrogenase catalytic domain-containing protein [Sporosarcina jiandibaonis]
MSNQNGKKVCSTAFRLTAPGIFKKETIEHSLTENDVIVEPYLASVCHADLRYFTGNRRKEALAEKLPMALFHEGLGVVQESCHPDFKTGDRVVIVPSIPGYVLHNKTKDQCCKNCQDGGLPNYCLESEFLGSGYDGIGQSRLVIGADNLVHVPDALKDDVAVLAELCSVSLFAINSTEKLTSTNSKKVAVFGDGPVGYLTAAALHFIYGVAKENLLVFGAVQEKLDQFENFATTALVFDYNFKDESGVKTVFECTGGQFSSSAINQAIDLLDSEGAIVLMGVTEELVPINTRDVLEKRIQLIGSSRSNVQEFKQLMDSMLNKGYQNALRQLIPETASSIESVADLTKAMEETAAQKGWKKTYLSFNWG